MNEERSNDPMVDEEADAAAKEAANIGGPTPNADMDPAERPVAEGGGGEAEGFEEAERDLIEHASHGDSAPDPSSLASDELAHPEPEYGQADHVRASERRDEDAEG